MVYQTVQFSSTLNDPSPNPVFKITLLFDADCLRNGSNHTDSYNKILIGTYGLLRGVSVSLRMTLS